jgi:hypothetical protein
MAKPIDPHAPHSETNNEWGTIYVRRVPLAVRTTFKARLQLEDRTIQEVLSTFMRGVASGIIPLPKKIEKDTHPFRGLPVTGGVRQLPRVS